MITPTSKSESSDMWPCVHIVIFRSPTKETLMVENDIVQLTADIVSAHVGHNSVSVSDLPLLISSVHHALVDLSAGKPVEEAKPEPAVSIRSSIKPDFIVCLEDGKKLKMLKRHLMTHYQLTPADYRSKWSLPADYPMVAPNYAAQRKELALKIGLGRKAGEKRTTPTPKTRQIKKTPAVAEA